VKSLIRLLTCLKHLRHSLEWRRCLIKYEVDLHLTDEQLLGRYFVSLSYFDKDITQFVVV